MTTKKADYIWFNGEMVRWEDAKVHVMSHALHYGTSVFEGIRCYDSHKGPVVFRHREHMQRLHDSAKIYRFPVSQSIDELMEACRDVIRKNNLTSAYIRPLIFVGDVGMGVNPPAGYSTDVIIAAFPWGAYLGAEALEQGIDAMVSSWNRAAPNTIPTAAKAGGNYLSSLLVGSEARRHGYQEGIALDVNGYISEGAGENLFEVKDGVLFTPPFTSSALPGITRDAIIKLAKELGIEVREQVLELFKFLKRNAKGFEKAVLASTAMRIGVRESRMIVGDYVLTQDDLTGCRRFEDSISACNYDIDIHNPEGSGTSHWYFKDGTYYTIPYRCLIPTGVDNLLVAGRCISSTHEAQASYRIMPTCCTLGQAAGTAAAMAAASDGKVRNVNVGELRKILTENGMFI